MLAAQEPTVVYPESDGQPMAETDVHRDLLLKMVELLKQAFPESYVSGNIFVYYVEGDPRKVLSPDALLCRGQGPRQKRIVRMWEENSQLDLVMEFTTPSTKKEDYQKKKKIYEKIFQIPYYLIYDPLAMKLDLYRLTETGYQAVENNEKGYWEMPDLGIQVGLELPHSLCLFDADGNRILDKAEAAQKQAEAVQKQADDALQQADDALQQAEKERLAKEEAKLEIEALKAQLKSLQVQKEI